MREKTDALLLPLLGLTALDHHRHHRIGGIRRICLGRVMRVGHGEGGGGRRQLVIFLLIEDYALAIPTFLIVFLFL